jgi:hypothetical protein
MIRTAASRRHRSLPGLLTGLLWLATVNCHGAPVEYQIKAVFLYNFGQYVAWPDRAFTGPAAPFRLCVLGRDPFGILLDVTVEGQQSEHRPIEVLRLQDLKQAGQCQILFLSADESGRSNRLLDWARQRPVLTISDQPGFAAAGGAVELIKAQDHIQLRINHATLRHIGLEAHANLLRLAEILDGDS